MSELQERLTIVDVAGRARRYDIDQLPISLGSGVDSDVFLDGTTAVVQIGRFEGAWFVQSARHVTGVLVNGVSISGIQRIGDGDEILVDRAALSVRIHDGNLRLTVQSQSSASVVAADRSSDDDSIAISPVNFRAGEASRMVEQQRFTTTRVAVSFAFIVLAVLGWFAFTAKSVRFSFSDEASVVSLPDTVFKLRLGERYLLRSGAHSVVAERDGYYPLNSEVVVGSAASQNFELAFEKLPGLVTLSADPVDSVSVFLDGQEIGFTPLVDYEMVPGMRELVFTKDRYFSQTLIVEVEGGHVSQSFDVELLQNWASVDFQSEPAGADVLVDGVVAGQTPVQLELEDGERAIEIRLAGYNAWQESLSVTAGQALSIEPVRLQQADGRIQLVSNVTSAAVSLNGEFVGTTPLDLRLRPGRTHTIIVTKPGHASATTNLTVAADSGRTVLLNLEPLFGDVSIASEPPGATILVDGYELGQTPAVLSLSALPHEISIELDGYAVQSRSLTPRSKFNQTLSFSLEALNDFTGDGYPRRIMTADGYELRVISAGEFTMGSSRREKGRRSNEVLRSVQLTSAFYLGTTEVTNAQFRAFRPEHDSGSVGEYTLNDDDQPVVNVSWADVAQFLNELSIRENLQPVYEEGPNGWSAVVPLRSGYRLPTEAEWAWAARFAEQPAPLIFPWSADAEIVTLPDRSGNYADISAAAILPTTLVTFNDDSAVTAPVNSYIENPLGLFDLGGNVAEWVHDYYSLDLLPSDGVLEDPLGPTSGAYHVIRGSSWRSATLGDLRMATRAYGDAGRDDIGFRIARNLQ